MGLLFWTIWCLVFWNRTKIERLTQFPKKLPPPLFSDIFQFSTIWDFFLEIASIAQFLSEIKNEGIKLFRRAIPFYPDPQKIGIHHIRGGGARPFSYEQFFRGNLKNEQVDTKCFGTWIEEDCSSEQFDAFFFDFGRKLSDWRNFQKNFRSPPIFRYIPVFHHFRGVRTFFGKLRQSLNFCPK